MDCPLRDYVIGKNLRNPIPTTAFEQDNRFLRRMSPDVVPKLTFCLGARDICFLASSPHERSDMRDAKQGAYPDIAALIRAALAACTYTRGLSCGSVDWHKKDGYNHEG